METKIFCMAIALLFCLSCKTIRNSEANTQNQAKADISLSQQDMRTGSEEVSAVIIGKSKKQTDRTERQSGGSVQLSPPDSIGLQYPTIINWYNNEIVETNRIIAEIKAMFQQQIEENERQILELREQLEQQSKEKTVSKTGFTFFEKIGFVSSGLLLLIVIFTLVKWLLKFRK